MKVLDVKDLGRVSKFLGTGIVYDELHGYMLNQRQAILELLERFGLADANAVRVLVVDDKNEGDDSALLPDANGTPWEMLRSTESGAPRAEHRCTEGAACNGLRFR
ncbi:hypothetical protein PR003_g7397 [Phytophthora rubi]|uniref:Uncharacterized protein n=1 Tax=Phytophthora rubi TaxID=129364 RepID=A0A6A4FE01_9STRA|nr:hypothetical protein PR001_g33381 [Phytophthora rubi]KAE9346482.1 hypothetical protein PR003_g7397 [Phytophthora rubi]